MSEQNARVFTTKNAIFQWFATQFDRMWNNDVAVETTPFVPAGSAHEQSACCWSMAAVNSWSKAGVMIRNSLSANSAYAFMIMSVAKGSVFQYRTSAAASAASIAGTAVAAPYWVKIVRNGNTIAGYQSPNGSSWVLVGSASIPIGPTVRIGLAATSHDDTRVAAATFDQISR